jgi:hypothetical protein
VSARTSGTSWRTLTAVESTAGAGDDVGVTDAVKREKTDILVSLLTSGDFTLEPASMASLAAKLQCEHVINLCSFLCLPMPAYRRYTRLSAILPELNPRQYNTRLRKHKKFSCTKIDACEYSHGLHFTAGRT